MNEADNVAPAARLITDAERQKLCEMIYRAFLEIRLLGWEEKAEQAASLADAFHNVPAMMWSEDFSLNTFRSYLQGYQEKYPENERLNFVKMFDRLFSE